MVMVLVLVVMAATGGKAAMESFVNDREALRAGGRTLHGRLRLFGFLEVSRKCLGRV